MTAEDDKPEGPCGYCPPGPPCAARNARRRAVRGACLRFYGPHNLSPVLCPGCGLALPTATANAGERVHPTCAGAES